MLYREWNICDIQEEKVRLLMQQNQISRLLAQVFVARGYESAQEVQEMLGQEQYLPDPMGIQDMDRAVERIHRAMEQEENIAVFGDYDVDGITATAMVYTYLEGQGANVYYKLPSRTDDSYGLSPVLVDNMADKGIDLIITVDNGTTAFEAAQRAKERGVSLVVTDHHLPYETLPEVDALINPCRADDTSGLTTLSGAGVAFMLICALEGGPAEDLLPEFGDLAAIGTVADVMKLTGPNRAIVKAGLVAIQHTTRPGLAALVEVCGWGEKDITAENISYGIAPRLNAAGRMDDATAALHLLLSEDPQEAQALVQSLQDQNVARQKAEQEILEIIGAQIDTDPALQHARVLVIWGEGWHQGVIGIVASRLVDKYAKPAIIITFDGEEGKGSGRSVAGFSLHGAISSCEDILIRFGGHDLAAGFSMEKQHAPEFRRRVNQWAAENHPVPPMPKIQVDARLELGELSVPEVASLDLLNPCGSGNPTPKILLQNSVVDGVYPVSEGRHCRLRLRNKEATVSAVLFGTSPEKLAYQTGDAVDCIVTLSIYEGKQGPMVSARLLEIRPAGMDNQHVAHSALFESFLAGTKPSQEQKDILAPLREDTAAVYRVVRSGGRINSQDLRPAFALLPEMQPGKVMTALAALEELNLIARDADTGFYRPVAVEGKKDLADSNLLQRLEA